MPEKGIARGYPCARGNGVETVKGDFSHLRMVKHPLVTVFHYIICLASPDRLIVPGPEPVEHPLSTISPPSTS